MEKTFAGARLRRLREGRSMSQVDLARVLAISPSYLNQIEHDTRPLTVPVLLRISEVFGVDAAFFASQDTARTLAELREALLGESRGGEISASDLHDFATGQPELAEAVLGLHRRYRHLLDQAETLAESRTMVFEADPHQQVRDFFYRHQNHFAELDQAAEATAGRIGARRGEVRTALRRHLEEAHSIRSTHLSRTAVQTGAGPDMHYYDEADRTLHFSPHLRPGQQAFRMATQVAFLEQDGLIEKVLNAEHFESSEVRQLARIGLANHFAGAMILPYTAFYRAAEHFRYDIELLAEHFGVGYETIAHRLSTLQRPGARGVPFIFVRVDRAGNISKRQSATGFHFSRTGGTCPLWNVYEAFAAPGRVAVQIASMPDGQRYLWVARTVTRHRGAFGEPAKTFAIGLGCELRHAPRLVYSRGMSLDDPMAATPIGPGCRTCDRPRCPQRAAAPIGRPLAIDESRSTFVPYPVQS
ncbi:short-chain fatty acyl-CoA regulator family protein [Frankia sp. AvcI1]|uniref:short-chain fatty acyl-CoA regulator family protein n=2 Tax=Frankia sp. AvcI1 TaxID=573496 RepID=UPI0021196478|nr:short-chain fatty acyl-CoA regulator family protein [Frankia sp. AvcI1]